MRFEKRVKAVFVGERKLMKDGRELKFYDLQYLVEGEGVGKVGIPEEFAVVAAQNVGKEVTLSLELEQDRRTQWLYRLNVLDVAPVGAEKPRAVVNA
jgi:hypothetical protein